ncbi:MAG TPA: HEPN domain-containing protein [Pyrinomonadaceae bacterium]|nr:hypothetical protein [Chloracidobacterium sp.]HRJ88997.1 HEPN domain-containing protein [Pyrinomonadaceae bacterium]HRK51583.1 HEPN domain-containing protein [Pyrinomonadaceae bacterium]
MLIRGNGKETYLLLHGLRVKRSIKLGDGLTVMPAKASILQAYIIDAASRGLEHTVAKIFLPIVHSQLHVVAADPKSVAVKAWNAIWDGMLLGALFDCGVECNLQSSAPVEELKKGDSLLVTNYNLRGFSLNIPKILTDKETEWVETHYSFARNLLDDWRFQNAVLALSSYRWHTHPRPRLAILWSGIEGLFEVDSEIVFRLSLYISRFLEPQSKKRRMEVFDHCKKLYGHRSKAVHGAKHKGDTTQMVEDSAKLLLRIIRKCVTSRSVPDSKSLIH